MGIFATTQTLLAVGLAALALSLDSALAEPCPTYEVKTVTHKKKKFTLSVCAGGARNVKVERNGWALGFTVTKEGEKKGTFLGTHPTMDDEGTVTDTNGQKVKKTKLGVEVARELGIDRLGDHGVCFAKASTDENDQVPAWFLAYEKIIRHDVGNEGVFRIAAKGPEIAAAEQTTCKYASEDVAKLLHRLCVDPDVTFTEATAPVDFSACVTSSNAAANALKRFFIDMGDAAWKADFAAQLFKEGGTLSEALANATPQVDALIRRLLQLFGEIMNTEVRPTTKMDVRALLCSSSPAIADEMSQMKIAGLCAMNSPDSTPVPIQNLERFISEVGRLPPMKAVGHRLRSNAYTGPRRGAIKRKPKPSTEPDTMLPDSVSEQGTVEPSLVDQA